MSNLGGHDMASMIEAFEAIDHDRPVCFIAYTIKGVGLPMQGHKDNHAGLMTVTQMEKWRAVTEHPSRPRVGQVRGAYEVARRTRRVPEGGAVQSGRPPPADRTCDRGAAATHVQAGGADVDAAGLWPVLKNSRAATPNWPRASSPHRPTSPSRPISAAGSTAADVRQAGEWIFSGRRRSPRPITGTSPKGQHHRAGHRGNEPVHPAVGARPVAPNGARLLPVGTLYDPFIERGLDALNYACYQDSRFMLVATPSGITLAPEGGRINRSLRR